MQKQGYTKLLARHHTGKIREHKHTSYGSLLLILLLAAVPIIGVSRAVAADTSGQGSYQTYAVVPGPTPGAPTISNLSSGAVYKTSDPVTVRGTCTTGSMVEIFKNDILAGAEVCQGGSYQINIDLFVGNNSIIARAYNANNVASPDSQPVSVTLSLPGFVTTGTEALNTQGAPAGQFYITSTQYYLGAETGQSMSWPLVISGGLPPYAVSVDWGDGKTDLFSRGTAGSFNITHAYAKTAGNNGSYSLVVKATDQAGDNSYMQLVAIVSGDSKAGLVSSVKGGYGQSLAVRLAWQGLAGVALVIVGFWVGEKREEHLLKQAGWAAK